MPDNGKCVCVTLLHWVAVHFILKVVCLVIPVFVSSRLLGVVHWAVYLATLWFSFAFTKMLYLRDKMEPFGRAVLITGCDTGFGHLLARRLDASGWHVLASCLQPEGAGALQLKAACSSRLHLLPLDVASDESVAHALTIVKDALGTSELWALVNNAGVHRGLSAELSNLDDFRGCLDVNALGPVRVAKAFLPLLRQARGRIVNLTSINGRIPGPYMSPYCMSKFAEVAFNDCLRQEMAVWGVKVISVEPEIFQTHMSDPKTIEGCHDATLASLSEETRSDYGEKFFERMRSWVLFNLAIASPRTDKVVDSLESAVSLEHPDLVYRPSRNLFTRVLIHSYELLPFALQDILVKTILYLTHFPTPIEAGNALR